MNLTTDIPKIWAMAFGLGPCIIFTYFLYVKYVLNKNVSTLVKNFFKLLGLFVLVLPFPWYVLGLLGIPTGMFYIAMILIVFREELSR